MLTMKSFYYYIGILSIQINILKSNLFQSTAKCIPAFDIQLLIQEWNVLYNPLIIDVCK